MTGAAPTTVRAPLRLDFAGGWTDVPPFATAEGGIVVNGALGLTAQATLVPGGDGIDLISHDLGLSVSAQDIVALPRGGDLELLQAALRCFPIDPPFRLETRSDAPPGSGLGSSGALGVALALVLKHARNEAHLPHDVADAAVRIETVEAGMAGGKQDQYAAAFGGFNVMTFTETSVDVESLPIDPGFASELARRTILWYTGRSRVSGATITRVMEAYGRGHRAVTGALREMKDLALSMVEALAEADLARVGTLLTRNWQCQQVLDPQMCTPDMRRLETAAAGEGGILGAKAAGAGAGGSMFVLSAGDPASVKEAALHLGMPVLPVDWSWEGARVDG